MRLPGLSIKIAAAVVLLGLALVLRFVTGSRASDRDEVTFNRDIAPVVFASCAPCHRPGEAGPFSLLDYDDASDHGREIVEVTRSHFMPPWLPDTPGVAYVGERRLTPEQIELFRRWHAAGMPEGDPADWVPPPHFPVGWQLGEPDLVVELPAPFTVPADGVDVIRNFVLTPPVEQQRWVRSVEIRPGNARVVHHAILKRDRTRQSRRLDERDPEPGFGGMEMGGSDYPEGQIIVWTPGMTPWGGAAGIAWALEPDADLVLQLHMVPSGKPEAVQPRLGFYFTDEAPEREPFTLLLRNDRIDIPAGSAEHVVLDSFVLPVPVTVLGLYPHAHYLGRRMEIWADAPAGERVWLLRIPHWDFNWQGMYHLRDPIELSRGSKVNLRYTYDNSADNPANPSVPPVRVRIGNRSSDEMATLAIQVLPQDRGAAGELLIAQWEDLLRDQPTNPVGHYNLGVAHAAAGDLARAAEHYERALALDPSDAGTHYYLASAYYRLGDLERAVLHYALAVEYDPDYAEAHLVLGYLLSGRGDLERAASHLERALALDPDLAQGHYFLGQVAERRGDAAGARAHYRRALGLDPGLAQASRALERLGQ